MAHSFFHKLPFISLLFLGASLVQASQTSSLPQGFQFWVEKESPSSQSGEGKKTAQPEHFGFSFNGLKTTPF